MALRDRAVEALRLVFGAEREERSSADSPSVAAAMATSPSMFSVWGREDIGGLLTVSQSLMDRFADYEAMEEYPDINCVAEGQRVYAIEGSVITPVPIEQVVMGDTTAKILAYDVKKKWLVPVSPEDARMTGRDIEVLEIPLSNGTKLRVTGEHKLLTLSNGYVNAKDVSAGDELISMWAGFEPSGTTMLINPQPGVVTITGDPKSGGTARVFDITTATHNFILEGAVVHNSAYHYYANDATQPSIKDNKTIWVASDNTALEGIGNDLLHKKLRVEDEIWSQAYSLGMYGNNYDELLLTESGVIGLNHLPVPTVRRVERLDGGLIGFVQDVTGQFTANSHELRKMLAGQSEIPKSLALFEDWQVIHMRLRATRRRSPYGVSVAEGGRWIWKRLTMMEDAVMIYKLCLRGDSQIWTPEGRTAIKDLNEGDDVYSYMTDGKLKKTKVVYKKHNGQDKIFRVHSDHREIFANKTHPVLVETITPQGSGRPRIRRLDYVEVQNLKPGVHRLVTPKKNADDWEEIKLKRPELHSKARLAPVGEVKRNVGLFRLQKSCGVQSHRIKQFFAGDYELKTDTAVALLDANGYGEEHLEVEEHWGGSRGLTVNGITVPDIADEDFARWWGFMLGDGFITTRNHKSGLASQNEVGFALGDKTHINDLYKKLFENYTPVKHVGNTGHRLGAYSVVSSKFAEFMTLNGFVPGAHSKRLPEWVFRAHPKIKMAMIRGLAEADAHIKPRHVSKIRGRVRYEVARFEMCNRELLEDVRELAMQMGIVVTLIRERQRKGGRTISGNINPLPDTTSYCMDVSFKPQADTEMLRGVEEVGTDDIWDIGVEADEHNFVADGVTVHNTRAPARYAFYVDVTDLPSDRVEGYLRKMKRDFKKKKMVNPRTGRMDMRYSPLANDEDFVIAVREGRELARVEVLSGPDYQNVDDVEYFKKMLHGALRVPREYLGQDGGIPSKSILSNEDVRAARVTLNLQREIRIAYERIIRVHLAARGVTDPWKPEFMVEMTIPSGIYEMAAYEVLNARADYASRVQPFTSTRWIQENVLKLSDADIEMIEKQRKEEAGDEQSGDVPSYAGGQGSAPPMAPEEAPPEEQPQDGPSDEEREQGAPEVRTQAAARSVDYRRRLEEWRYSQSCRRHDEIKNLLGNLTDSTSSRYDPEFAERQAERQKFFKDLRGLVLSQQGGGTRSAPQRQGTRPRARRRQRIRS